VNVEGAKILLDDAEFRASSIAGDNFIANLRVRSLKVAVTKEGFPVPEPKVVTLRKGETVTVEFTLTNDPPKPPQEQKE
jgi:hypothetical protein